MTVKYFFDGRNAEIDEDSFRFTLIWGASKWQKHGESALLRKRLVNTQLMTQANQMANYLWEVPSLQIEADNKHIPRNPED